MCQLGALRALTSYMQEHTRFTFRPGKVRVSAQKATRLRGEHLPAQRKSPVQAGIFRASAARLTKIDHDSFFPTIFGFVSPTGGFEP